MSFHKKLEEHLETWVQKGIVSQEQQNSILNDISEESSSGKLFRILSIIGVIFVGSGAILMISANWAGLPKMVKLLLILLMPIASTGVGYYLSYVRVEYERIGNALLFLGALLVGASLALLGQLYNIDGSVGNLLLLWFALTVPFTFIFKFRVLATLTVVLLYMSLFYLILGDSRWWAIDERSVVLIFTAVSFAVVLIGASLRKIISSRFTAISRMFETVSLKVLFGTLFIGLLENGDFALFGESFASVVVQNVLFLIAVFIALWVSFKHYNAYLHHSTFFWLGLYIVVKYFSWFWSYMDTGLFFMLFGIFLLALVYGYIRFSKYMEKKKKLYKEEVREEIKGEVLAENSGNNLDDTNSFKEIYEK